jgi:catechol 2,3-dioxygenase-like lactoylglutathione lyase family enzyme
MHTPFKSVNAGFVAMSVANIEASAQWYAEKLGLTVVKQATSADKSRAVAILQGHGLNVELIWLADAVPLAQIAPELKGSHQVHGIFKAGIFVDDLDAAWSELKSRHVSIAFEPFFDASMRCRMFAIRDGDGNILQFFGE